jgi:hypothetical protein
MINSLILLLSTTAAINSQPSDVLAGLSAGTLPNPRISHPRTAQLPVAKTQFTRNGRRRTNKKIKGKAKKAMQMAQANGINSQEADRVGDNSRSNENGDNLLDDNDTNTMFSSVNGDDVSAFLSVNPQDPANGVGEYEILDQLASSLDILIEDDNKPDWVRIDKPTVEDDDEWSVL